MYLYLAVRERHGEACRMPSRLPGDGVDLVACDAVPMGGETTRLALFKARARVLAS